MQCMALDCILAWSCTTLNRYELYATSNVGWRALSHFWQTIKQGQHMQLQDDKPEPFCISCFHKQQPQHQHKPNTRSSNFISSRHIQSLYWIKVLHWWLHHQASFLYLSVFLLPSQLLQHGFKLLLLLLGFLYGGLALLLISHGYYSQDQIDQVEGSEENHQHKEYHVGLPRSPQCLKGKQNTQNIHKELVHI